MKRLIHNNEVNMFGSKLFSFVAGEKRNIVLSPLSVFSALGMTLLGAKGQTYDEIKQTLNMKGDSSQKILEEISKLLQMSKSLQLANNTFISTKIKIHNFFQDIKSIFKSEITSLDFENSEMSRKIINEWIESKTENKIKNMISSDSLDQNTIAVLVSALYFKANWQKQFDVKNTMPMPFYIDTANNPTQVQMMSQFHTKEEYGENDVAKWIKLPYNNNNNDNNSNNNNKNNNNNDKFSAYFVLPRKRGDLSSVSSFLFYERGINLPTRERKLNVIRIPKFKLSYSLELIPLLQNMGIRSLFNNSADLSGISPELFVTSAQHSAVVEVDEVGTVASAVTVVLCNKFVTLEVSKEFVADEPFFFVVSHSPFNSIVLISKVHNPNEI